MRSAGMVGALGSVLLPVALVLGGPAPAAAADVRPADDACPAAVPPSGLGDVARGSTHAAAVDCLAWWGVTRGISATEYGPARSVSRAQMATFLAGTVTRLGGDLPVDPPDAFSDDEGSVHERAVDRLAAVGVVAGRGGGLFDPSAPVRRDQMATFLVRALEYVAGEPLPAGPDAFGDDAASVHAGAIDKAAAAGLAGGVAPGRYDPVAAVRRDQMASFLTRALDSAVEGRSALLRLAVTGLPAGAQADLRLVGDLGRALPGDGTAAVPAGVVDVTARPVLVDGTEFTGAVDGTAVTATAGSLVTATAEYVRPVVADDTVVVPAEQVQGAEVAADGSARLQVAPAAPEVAVGDVVVTGVGPQTPEGLLGTVQAVTESADGTAVVTTSPASLFDAVPEGAFDVVASDGVVTGSGQRGAAATGLEAVARDLRENLSCGASGEVSITGSFTVTPDFHLAAKWGGPLWNRRVETATFSATVTESAELRATARAAAGCTLERTALLPRPIRLRPVTFSIGPVPVVVVPQVQLYLDAEGEVTSELVLAQTQTFTATAGLRYERGAVTPFSEVGNRFGSELPTDPTETGHLAATIGPQLDLLFYGVAGPGLTVDGTARLDVALDEDPWWVATARLRAGVAFTVPLLRIDERKPDVLSRTWTVAQAPPRAGAVCAGVARCEQVAEVDVDGDGRLDQVAVVPTGEGWPDTGYTVRVLTRTGLFTRAVTSEYWSGEPYIGATRIDSGPGDDLVVGTVHGAHTQWFTVLAVQDGQLVELPPPPGWGGEWGWLVDGSFAFNVGMTCEGPGEIVMREADLADGVTQRYDGAEERFSWSRGGWISTSRSEFPLQGAEVTAPFVGWTCPGLPRY